MGNCNDQPSFTSILFNGTEIWSPGGSNGKRFKIKNNPGLYTVKVFMWLSAIQRNYTYSFYISDKMAVGINEPGEAEAGLALLPNPASGQFRIESAVGLKSVSVFDLTGKRLSVVQASGNSVTVPLEGYPRGIYLVQAATEAEKITVKKLVVQ